MPNSNLPAQRLTRHVALPLLLVLVLAADLLLFGQEPGLNRFLTCLLVAASLLLLAPSRTRTSAARFAPVAILSLLPMIEAPTLSSLIVASLGLVLLALAAGGLLPKNPTAIPATLARFVLKIPPRSFHGAGRLMQTRALPATARGIGTELRFWILPLILGAVFVGLFAGANPLIDRALEAIDLGAILSLIDLQRLAFWLMTAGLVWILFRPKLSRRFCRRSANQDIALVPPSVISEPVLFRALILFNLLFAIQTMLDMAYLWGGMELPEGMSHAEYAHRGAYPLVITALLAALFVLVAIPRGQGGAHTRLIRALVYVWIAQNILLCLSAILRLDLYVVAYSLTGMRVAAGLWMLLVAAGLALILLRILFDKSNAWLFAMNAACLIVVLYGVAVTNIEGIIASYNVEHSRDLDGGGAWLDIEYLASLGPAALPALDTYLARASFRQLPDFRLVTMYNIRRDLSFEVKIRSKDWRSWTWRAHRLEKHLAGPVPLD